MQDRPLREDYAGTACEQLRLETCRPVARSKNLSTQIGGGEIEHAPLYIQRPAKRSDLIQLHCLPKQIFYQPDVFGLLDDLISAGKIRHYGVSVEKVEEALKGIEYPNVKMV